MAVTSACPDVPTLENLLVGQLPPEEVERLAAHCESCEHCVRRLGALEIDDTVVSAMAAQATVVHRPAGSAVQALVQRLKETVPPFVGPVHKDQAATIACSEAATPAGQPEAPSGSATEELFAFLLPPQGSGELGRLGGYRVLKVLGAGGMGVVFQAEDVQLHRLVSLKAIRPSLVSRPSARTRFLREARALAAIKHDHVVTIHQVGEDRGVPFLAMEFLEGESLHDRLQREPRLPVPEVLRFGSEIATGLAAAHARGVIHRDIKPANIWLEARDEGRGTRGEKEGQEDGRSPSRPSPLAPRVKILDFGLARPTTEDDGPTQGDDVSAPTQAGAILGTPAFMSPEQARGAEVDRRSDLFSLGCVLYRMTTGELPFHGNDIMSTLLSLAQDTPRSPRRINPEVPPELGDLIMQLLAKDAEKRPVSAEAVAARLDAIAAAERGATRTAPRRSRRFAVAAVLAFSAAACFFLAPLVLRVETADGTLIVQIPEEESNNVQLLVKQGGRQVELLDLKTQKRITLPAGAYQLELVGGKEGLRLESKHLELKRGDRLLAKVIFEPLAAKPPPAPKEPDPAAAKLPPPDQPSPFFVISAGQTRKLKHLSEAVAVFGAGDRIEIHGNGPFPVPPLRLSEKGLDLRAGPGYRPLLVYKGPANGYLFKVQADKAPLRLEGCDFHCANGLAWGSGTWKVENCRIRVGGIGFADHHGPALHIKDSVIAATILVGVGVGSGELELTNNLIYTSGTAISLVADKAVVRLRNNTFLGGGHGSFLTVPAKSAVPSVVEASGNIFQAPQVVLAADDQVRQSIQWRGNHNLYAVTIGFLRTQDLKFLLKDLAAWNQYWGVAEEGTREVKEVVHCFAEARRKDNMDKAMAWVRRSTEALRQKHGLAELGPRWDMVGPGEAYLRALAESGKAVAKNQLRPPAPVEGPFVLARAGKPVQGYQTLQDALVAAGTGKGGDTVEIRGDGPFAGNSQNMVAKTLTVRAAPGYRPVLDGWLEWRAGSLVVEGIHFRKGRIWDMTGNGKLARVVNCSFDAWEAPICLNIWAGTDGTPAEISNCWIPGAVWLYGPKVIFRDCLFGTVYIGAPPESTLELDRCVLWNPGLGARTGSFRDVAFHTHTRLAITARASLLESSSLFGPNIRWQGSGNAYRGIRPGLHELREVFKSSEKGSVEAEPLIWDPQQWRLLPESPGYRAGPDGKDLGADVDQVARTTHPLAKIVGPPAVVPAPLLDQPNPFFVISAAGQTRKLKHLSEALAVFGAGDRIEIHGNGPFAVPPLRLSEKGLDLRAGPGYRPLLVYKGPASGYMFLVQADRAPLRLEGCDFHSPYGLALGSGTWKVENCRIRVGGIVFPDHRGPALHIKDSVIAAMTIVGGSGKWELELTNNLIYTAATAISLSPDKALVRLRNNTFLGGSHGSFLTVPVKSAAPSVVEASGNIFQAHVVVHARHDPRQSIQWRGNHNLYAVTIGVLTTQDGKCWLKDLAAWNQYWGVAEEGTREAKDVLHCFAEAQRKDNTDKAMAWVRKSTEALRQKYGLPELGPRWDMVGPGEAYLRALAESGKPVAKDQLRPPGLVGGPFVLIRDHKPMAGYQTLQDALIAAGTGKGGDTVEIRGDGPFGGARIAPAKAMAIRAAPGYRPVLDGGLSWLSGSLVIEGVHFRKGGISNDAIRGKLTRMVNCSFDAWEAPVCLNNMWAGTDGTPAEISNCWIPGAVSLSGSKVIFRDCLLGTVSISAPPESTLELDRCVLWNPGLAARTGVFRDVAFHTHTRLAITARATLFESCRLFASSTGYRWQGSGNAYRGIKPGLLDELREVFKSPEKGSVEAEPLIWDPQQWRLLPESAGYRAGPDGKDLGADVDCVARTLPAPEKADGPPTGTRPLDAAWIKKVAALPTAKQVAAVVAKLKERNPGFDGEVSPKVEHGAVTEFALLTDKVADISPLRALTRLRALTCRGSGNWTGRLIDLSPLEELNLTSLNCDDNKNLTDLSPLAGMKLTELRCKRTRVADLSPLKDMKLALLDCPFTAVADLSPLEGMPLTPVADLSPLKKMKLERKAKRDIHDLLCRIHVVRFSIGDRFQFLDFLANLGNKTRVNVSRSDIDLVWSDVNNPGAQRRTFAFQSGSCGRAVGQRNVEIGSRFVECRGNADRVDRPSLLDVFVDSDDDEGPPFLGILSLRVGYGDFRIDHATLHQGRHRSPR